MGFAIKDIPQQTGGWFKPEDGKSTEAVAFLIEVNDFKRQQPTNYGPKDTIYADITTFQTAEELEKGIPSDVVKNTQIQQTVLVRDLVDLVGSATVVQLSLVPSKKPGQNPAWVWRTTSQATKDAVIKYATAREAAVAAALDDAPDFD
jgi:hypothetical protein